MRTIQKPSHPVTNNKVSEEPEVSGLSTSALADGEFTDAKSGTAEPAKPAQKSALDIATSIEAKMKALLERVQNDDKEVDQKLANLTKKIEELRKSR